MNMMKQTKTHCLARIVFLLTAALLAGIWWPAVRTVSRAEEDSIQKLYNVQEVPASLGQKKELKNPVTNSDGISTWDCVWFGSYWQERNDNNEALPFSPSGPVPSSDQLEQQMIKFYSKTPIKWRVLSVDGDDVFLMADQLLDMMKYNETGMDITWETCTLRSWLNGYGAAANTLGKDYSGNGFLDHAFTEAERQAIKTTNVVNNDNKKFKTEGGNNTSDKIYLLSSDEAVNPAYGFNDSKSETEKFAESRRAWITSYAKRPRKVWEDFSSADKYFNMYFGQYVGNGSWWLRSPGDSNHAAGVTYAGCVDTIGVELWMEYYFVRPVLHLDLNEATAAASWSYAGTISASGGPKQTASPVYTSKPKVKPIETVTRLKVTAKKRRVAVTWKKSPGVRGYQICYSTSKKWKNKKQKLVSKNKAVITNLKKKKTYYFRVRAYRVEGKKKVYGTWSSVKKIKIKK